RYHQDWPATSPGHAPRAHPAAAHPHVHALHRDATRRGGLPRGELVGVHALTVAGQAGCAPRPGTEGGQWDGVRAPRSERGPMMHRGGHAATAEEARHHRSGEVRAGVRGGDAGPEDARVWRMKRERAPVLWRMLETCVLTVLSFSPSLTAISAFVRPRPISVS